MTNANCYNWQIATIGKDRRNDKAIINSHTHKWRYRGSNPDHGIRHNFSILPVELGLLDNC
ncbi:hypothetical protein MTR_1g057100 [Medicago truncatula]|uniref:Uncharacterized protein n=1 Tax=Medicago truncatula TaxID=3880 RepID=A0A072VKG3_MEDTR|nr:hypothetical protein MTR_1g057100 [Medicago truncatula]